MSQQEESTRGIRHGAGGKARDKESASRRAFKGLGRNAFFLQDGGDIFRGDKLVARRVRGINAEQALQPAERVDFDLRKSRICGRRGLHGLRGMHGGSAGLRVARGNKKRTAHEDKNRSWNARARHPDFPQRLKFVRRASDYSYYHVGGRRPDGESARVF